MKFRIIVSFLAALGFTVPTPAAEDEVQQLKDQLQQLRAAFEKTRREQEQQIDALTRKLDALTPKPPATAAPPAAADAQKKLEQELAAELAGPPAAPRPTNAERSAPPPIATARAGTAYMNLSYGTLIDAGWSSVPNPSAQLELGDHDPIKRGFSLRNAELAIDGAIDPYFKGAANIVLKLDENNETAIELEESYLETTSLPANLQFKAGQYFTNFGRQNPQHPHAWAFVDQPLILNRVFGPDGLRSIGAQLSWLAPTPFYSELFLSVLDGQGGTAFSVLLRAVSQRARRAGRHRVQLPQPR